MGDASPSVECTCDSTAPRDDPSGRARRLGPPKNLGLRPMSRPQLQSTTTGPALHVGGAANDGTGRSPDPVRRRTDATLSCTPTAQSPNGAGLVQTCRAGTVLGGHPRDDTIDEQEQHIRASAPHVMADSGSIPLPTSDLATSSHSRVPFQLRTRRADRRGSHCFASLRARGNRLGALPNGFR
jgi:hypothetical protein